MLNKKPKTAEELWQRILATNTIHEWMELTDQFNLFRIYDHFRILDDQQRIETYRCRIYKAYLLTLDAYDVNNASAPCFMILENGNLRRSSSPTNFDILLGEGMRSAQNDGPYVSGENEESDLTTDNTPAVVKIAAIIELLHKMEITRASYDTIKFITIIAFLTGCSEKYVSRKLYEGFKLTDRHKPYIDRINQLFCDFNLDISLNVGTSY